MSSLAANDGRAANRNPIDWNDPPREQNGDLAELLVVALAERNDQAWDRAAVDVELDDRALVDDVGHGLDPQMCLRLS